MEFNDYVYQFKEEMNLSDRDIARIMGVGAVTLENYFSGYVEPSERALDKLLNTLAVRDTPEYRKLMFLDEKPNFQEIPVDELRRHFHEIGCYAVDIEKDCFVGSQLLRGGVAMVRMRIEPQPGDILYVSIDEEKPCFKGFDQTDAGLCLWDGEGRMEFSRDEFKSRVRVAGRLTAMASKVKGTDSPLG